jgi:O-antigen ligase
MSEVINPALNADHNGYFSPRSLYSKCWDGLSLLMLCLSTLFLSFSTAGLEATDYLALIGFLVGGSYRQKLRFIQQSPWILSALAFYVILLIWIAFSPAVKHEIFQNLSAYEKVLLVPVGLWVFHVFPKFRKLFLILLSAGILLNFVLSFFKFHGFWPAQYQTFQLGHASAELGAGHIALSYFASVLAFSFGVLLIHQFKQFSFLQKMLCTFALVISLYYLLMLTIGRSGQLTLAILILYGIARAILNFKAYKTGIFIFILSGLLVLGAHHFSSTFKENLTRGTADIQEYKNGNEDTSWGLRLTFWKNSLKLIQHHPLLGYGTGTMRAEYLSLNTPPDPHFVATPNPHNQYLFLMVEQGIPGLLAFLAFVYLAGKNSISLKVTSAGPQAYGNQSTDLKNLQTLKLLLEGAVLAFVVGCCYNSWLHDVHEGFFTIFLWVGLRSWLPPKQPAI